MKLDRLIKNLQYSYTRRMMTNVVLSEHLILNICHTILKKNLAQIANQMHFSYVFAYALLFVFVFFFFY